MMMRTWGTFAALLMASGTAQAVVPATLARSGGNGQAACASCHAVDGGGQGAFPRLAGLDARYLQKQLQDFASGSRKHVLMQPIAKALTREDQAAMAAYYAAMPVPARLRARKPPSDAGPGARLALRGAWDRGVPGCTRCHGPEGRGVGAAFPPLAGQPAEYIAAQLRAWKAGERANDPLELMRHLSAQLTAGEIQAVSQWFAEQPVRGAAR